MEGLLCAVLLYLIAGAAALICAKSPRLATWCGAGGPVAAALVGLLPVWRALAGGETEAVRFAWDASHGVLVGEIDGLSAFFLLPVLVLSALTAIYGGSYLFADGQKRSLGAPWFFFNLFVAGMVLVLIARTALLFLMAWEIMSLAAFFLVTFEHEKAEVRRAGWVYLIATHLGAAFLFFALVFLGWHAGSSEFAAFRPLPAVAGGVVFALALIGFGAKAGLVPFHVWLPEAHPAAPSHVSALMSAVMIKMGLYGLLRVLTFLGPPAAWWGPTLAILGLATALVGLALALQQRDIKRVLAYSSIENMGLISLALGIGLSGAAQQKPAVAVLGVTAALFHVWNHAVMKGMMFLAAGSILHATGTRDMERLGGLMKRMPWTAGALSTGALALAALPPLNGFVGKWLMYMTLIQDSFGATGGRGMVSLLAVGLVALVGGLAAITFVRLVGIVLLGSPRTEDAAHAHESSAWFIGPMVALGVFCFAAAIVPHLIADSLFGVVDQLLAWRSGSARAEFDGTETPLAIVGNINGWLLVFLGSAGLLATAWVRRSSENLAEGPTWGCGYVQPTTRMQYTGRSFTEMIAELFLPRFLRMRKRRQAPEGLFPAPGKFATQDSDPVSQKGYEPFFQRCAHWMGRVHAFQAGQSQVYLVYVLAAIVLALGWMFIREPIQQWWSAP